MSDQAELREQIVEVLWGDHMGRAEAETIAAALLPTVDAHAQRVAAQALRAAAGGIGRTDAPNITRAQLEAHARRLENP